MRAMTPHQDSNTLKVLVFSHSDAAGRLTGGRGWGTMLAEPGPGNLKVELVEFFAGAPSSAAYAARKVGQLEPDVAVLPIGTYGFALELVEHRVRRLFGERAARWYKRAENGFDSRTRQAAAAPGGVNSLGRRLLRATIGAEGAVSQSDYTAHVTSTLTELATFESLRVVIVTAYPGVGSLATPRIASKRAEFLGAVTALARRHHFELVSVEEVLAGNGPLGDLLIDDIHLSPAGHDLLGPAVRAAVLG